MAGLFQKIGFEAFRAGITPRTKESRDWFRKRASRLRAGRMNRESLMREDPIEKQPDTAAGNMYMFFYDPKHKKTLPYYDRFPLVIVVGPAKDGFYGLNLHYLPPILRAKFLDELYGITSNSKFDDTTKFKMSYQLLKRAEKMKYFKPCFKHYLNKHVKSQFAYVPAPEWEIATFLPTAQWTKAQSNQVYKDSRRAM